VESQRFDRITKQFANSSRRRVFGALAAGALAAVAPLRAAAICTPESCDASFPCGRKVCQNGLCKTIFDPAGTVCRPAAGPCDVAEVCSGNSFDCPADRHADNGTPCPDDGNPCTDDVCQGGVCAHPNKADGAACPDDGNLCTDDVCQAGTCAHPNKADGTTCAAGKICQAGGCECAAGADNCGEICTDLNSDEDNCGACGRRCGNGEKCCRGLCAKLSSDEENCGQCGKRCRNGQLCRKGRCRKG
jgi:hypothetical protein